MAQIKNIIFDFDGTLVDTAPLIVKTMQATIREMSLPARTEAECRATIGLRLEDIPAAVWPELHCSGAEYARIYRRIFDELKRPLSVKCFPGVIDILGLLHRKGFRMAIASSRSRKSLEEYVDLFGLDDYFSMLVGGNDVKHGKPAPEPVTHILDAQGWRADETLVVGDASVDIIMGKAAGVRTCAVSYGNGSAAELEASEPDYTTPDFHAVYAIANGVAADIIRYVCTEIIPRYEAFDKAHRADHANMVIEQSLGLAADEPDADADMVYVVASFHDLGLVNGREYHHIDSRKILEADGFIQARFTPEQIRIMGEAVEDHRASAAGKPRNIYGLIVAEADRFIDAETIIRRTIQYGLKNYPDFGREGHYDRTIQHLVEKYGPDGYLTIWMPQSDNAVRLEELRSIIADKAALRSIFDRLFDEETSE